VRLHKLIPALAVLATVIFPATAHAAAWRIEFEPSAPVAGQPVSFHAERDNPGQGSGDSLRWDFGDGGTGTGEDPGHTYAASGSYTVTLSSPEGDGTFTVEDTEVVGVGEPPNQGPSAAFGFTPSSPVAGTSVLFTGGSDPDGTIVSRLWQFGDGENSGDVSPTHTYSIPGVYTASLTVTDDDGAFDTSSRQVTVQEAPPDDGETPPDEGTPPPDEGTPPPGDGTPTGGTPLGGDPTGTGGTPLPQPLPGLPRRMRPFPVVRIAGVVLPTGADVQILSVRAPRGARVRVRCRGLGCPVASLARTAATRVERFRRFERRLRAGIRIAIFVRQTGRIGKYTRFLIRAGRPPARVDKCLVPGRSRPVSCS
jgi:PKD repeat protein